MIFKTKLTPKNVPKSVLLVKNKLRNTRFLESVLLVFKSKLRKTRALNS